MKKKGNNTVTKVVYLEPFIELEENPDKSLCDK